MPEQREKPRYEPVLESDASNLFMTLAEGFKGPSKYPNAFVDGLPNGMYFTKGIPLGSDVPAEYSKAFNVDQLIHANHLLITPEGIFHVTSPSRVAVNPLSTDINPVLNGLKNASSDFPTNYHCNETDGWIDGGTSNIHLRKLHIGSDKDKRLMSLILKTTNELNPPVVKDVNVERLLGEI